MGRGRRRRSRAQIIFFVIPEDEHVDLINAQFLIPNVVWDEGAQKQFPRMGIRNWELNIGRIPLIFLDPFLVKHPSRRNHHIRMFFSSGEEQINNGEHEQRQQSC